MRSDPPSARDRGRSTRRIRASDYPSGRSPGRGPTSSARRSAHSMRLQPVLLPDAVHGGRTKSHLLGQSPGAPMGRAACGGRIVAATTARSCAGVMPAPTTARVAAESRDALRAIAPAPQTDRRLADPQPLGQFPDTLPAHAPQLVDELILLTNISAADPPRLSLVDHVHRFVSLDRSPGGVELAKALVSLHSAFDRSMVLLQDVVQVLHRSMAAAVAQGSSLFHTCNRRAVEAGLIGVDDARLRMCRIVERLAEIGVRPPRHRAAPRTEIRWWRRWNRWLDR
jgi:hypothetical protein